ncbi:MAG: cyclic nucleotide-binding domain-containing protein [Bacteriovoracaceae bacterium]|nr:cyclic nucleotide-binding domain-containing protein [Bacteriovoracaceae bacterium]
MSKSTGNKGLTLNLKKDEVVCVGGEKNFDLYIIVKGKLLIMVNKGTQITPLAYLNEGEYMGELSFFDQKPRSAHVVCAEDTTLIKIPVEEINKQFPKWLTTMAVSITSRLRKVDELIGAKGIRKQKVDSVKPLSIDEQRKFFQILEDYTKEKGLSSIK